MKKIVKILLALIFGIIILLVAIYAYYGGFRTVNFEVKEAGGEVFVYENVTGDYSQSPVVMDSIYYALLNDYKIGTTKGAGMYYDNPQQVEKSKLRSEIGCILDTYPDSMQMVVLSNRFKVKVLPKGNYIVGEFPNKGMISTIVGIMKVYPALTKYIETAGYKKDEPVMEIYDVPAKVIIYRQSVSK
ncbi:GyrI-like domain-containing protein [Dysgonomonas termitidis]|uniref:GyrI-like domain-containing protein n=1 Tax=Dysgonomonas termitidis TaxID=1516126 RepID=A0ABV9KXR0_9BACT